MSAAERTKDRSNLLQHWEGRVLGLSSATSRKVLSDRPALKPDWGKPTVRNFRGEDGNGSYRAILLPERKAEPRNQPSLYLRLRAPYLYPDPTATEQKYRRHIQANCLVLSSRQFLSSRYRCGRRFGS